MPCLTEWVSKKGGTRRNKEALLQGLDPGANFIRPALRGIQNRRTHFGELAIDHSQPWVGRQAFAVAGEKTQ